MKRCKRMHPQKSGRVVQVVPYDPAWPEHFRRLAWNCRLNGTCVALALILCQRLTCAEAKQLDRLCLQAACESLVVREGQVHFVDPALNRDLILGPYVRADQRFVPRNEAPLRELRSDGWRIVVSALLGRAEGGAKLRIRFFDPRGGLRGSSDAMMDLVDAQLGHLFGRSDEILAFTCDEEHAYNVQTEVWLLPERGKPKLLVEVQGMLGEFVAGSSDCNESRSSPAPSSRYSAAGFSDSYRMAYAALA